jgi:uncharacterized protein YkwD
MSIQGMKMGNKIFIFLIAIVLSSSYFFWSKSKVSPAVILTNKVGVGNDYNYSDDIINRQFDKSSPANRLLHANSSKNLNSKDENNDFTFIFDSIVTDKITEKKQINKEDKPLLQDEKNGENDEYENASSYSTSPIMDSEDKYKVKECVEYSQEEVYRYFNRQRKEAGLNELKPNMQLEQSATSHAMYLQSNHLTGHFEKIPDDPFFTGESTLDRVVKSGVNVPSAKEGISYRSNAIQSIDDLMLAIYHRFTILSFNVTDVGIGLAYEDAQCVYALVHNIVNNAFNTVCNSAFAFSDDYECFSTEFLNSNICINKNDKMQKNFLIHACGENTLIESDAYQLAKYAPKDLSKYVLYPPDEASDVIRAFVEEKPDPLPDRNVSGNPISIQFNPHFYVKGVENTSFKLFSNDNKEVDDVRILDHQSDPNGIFTSYQYALFPLQILAEDSIYRAKFSFYNLSTKQDESIEWSFSTKKKLF